MMVAKFRIMNILNAVITQLATYIHLMPQYQRGITEHSKNVLCFWTHILISEQRKDCCASECQAFSCNDKIELLL